MRRSWKTCVRRYVSGFMAVTLAISPLATTSLASPNNANGSGRNGKDKPRFQNNHNHPNYRRLGEAAAAGLARAHLNRAHKSRAASGYSSKKEGHTPKGTAGFRPGFDPRDPKVHEKGIYRWLQADGSHIDVKFNPSKAEDIYKAAPRELWQRFKGSTIGETTVQFAPEAFAFYMAIGLSTLIQLEAAAEKDPSAIEHYIESLKDPVAYGSFYAFMYTHRKVARFLMNREAVKLLQAQGMRVKMLKHNGIPLTRGQKSLLTLAVGTRHIIGYLGLASGSFVSEVLHELAIKPEVHQCAAGLIIMSRDKTNEEDRAKWRNVCQEGFGHFINEEARTRHMGSIISLLSGAIAIAATDTAIKSVTGKTLAGGLVTVSSFAFKRLGFGLPELVANAVLRWSERILHYTLFFESIDLVGVPLQSMWNHHAYRSKVTSDFKKLMHLRDQGNQNGWAADPTMNTKVCQGLRNRSNTGIDGYDSWYGVNDNVDYFCQGTFQSTLKDYVRHQDQWRRALMLDSEASFANWMEHVSHLTTTFVSATNIYKDVLSRARQNMRIREMIESEPELTGEESPKEVTLAETFNRTRDMDSVLAKLVMANENAFFSFLDSVQGQEGQAAEPSPAVSRWSAFDRLFAGYHKEVYTLINKVLADNSMARTEDKYSGDLIHNLRALNTYFRFSDPSQKLDPQAVEDIKAGLAANMAGMTWDLPRQELQELSQRIARAAMIIEGTTLAWALYNDRAVNYPQFRRVSKPIAVKTPLGTWEVPFLGDRGFSVLGKIIESVPDFMVTDVPGESTYARTLESTLGLDPEMGEIVPNQIGRAEVRNMTEYVLTSMACGPKSVDPNRPNYAKESEVIVRPLGRPVEFHPPRVIKDLGFDACSDLANMTIPLDKLDWESRRTYNGLYRFNPFSQTWRSPDGRIYNGIVDLIANNIDPAIMTSTSLDFPLWWREQAEIPYETEMENQQEEYKIYLVSHLYPALAGHDPYNSRAQSRTGISGLIDIIRTYFHTDRLRATSADQHVYDPVATNKTFDSTYLGSLHSEAVVLMKSMVYLSTPLMDKAQQASGQAKLQQNLQRFSEIFAQIQQQLLPDTFDRKLFDAHIGELHSLLSEVLDIYRFPFSDVNLMQEKQQFVQTSSPNLGLPGSSHEAQALELWQIQQERLINLAFSTSAASEADTKLPATLGVIAPQIAQQMEDRLNEGYAKMAANFAKLPKNVQKNYARQSEILRFTAKRLVTLVDDLKRIGPMAGSLKDLKFDTGAEEGQM